MNGISIFVLQVETLMMRNMRTRVIHWISSDERPWDVFGGRWVRVKGAISKSFYGESSLLLDGGWGERSAIFLKYSACYEAEKSIMTDKMAGCSNVNRLVFFFFKLINFFLLVDKINRQGSTNSSIHTIT